MYPRGPRRAPMRQLILADIHANIDALEAINESFDRVLFLGDLVDYGPAPEEAIQWIRKAGAEFSLATSRAPATKRSAL